MSMRGGYVSDSHKRAWRESLASGMTVEQIAERSGFSVATVKKHTRKVGQRR